MGFSRETKPIECDRENEIYFKQLAYVIVEVWQVQNLMGEAGRLQTQARIAVQVQSQCVSELGQAVAADGVQRQAAGRISSCSWRGQPFVLFSLSTDWMRPPQHYGGQSAFLKVH